MYKAVVWDWNGTILNDVEYNLCIVNTLMQNRGMKPIKLEVYRSAFKMPIRNFYTDIGFDLEKEDFEKLASEYNRMYKADFSSIPLTEGVLDVLECFYQKGVKQYIVSASEQNSLDTQVKEKGLEKFFTQVVGNDDYSVVSKTDKARELKRRIGSSGKILFVGDMDHDYEAALAMGADCVLYTGGHQKVTDDTRWKTIGRMKKLFALHI
ncbi:MAG TPA: HAD hydrolase-like protein [Treponemataceae bacterium]|nr:HAD hydrolase-like protein [Treponemataceae bacterium]HQL05219.1 HAD hydrolase-like protein [Treponemataceae bacterium]